MINLNKEGHVPQEKLIEQLTIIYRANGIEMPREVLLMTFNITDAFLDFLQEDRFCNECKRKLYEAIDKK